VVEQLRDYRRGVAAHLAEAEEQARFAHAYAQVSGAASTASAPTSAEAIRGAKCASCGAANGFEVGATFSTCVHCGASLLANAQIQARGLSTAARTAHTARLEALKSERYFAVTLARKNRFFSYQPAVFGIGIPAIAAPLFAFSDLPDASTQALAAAAASVLAAGVVAAVMTWRKGMRARAADAVAPLAAAYAGTAVVGVDGIAKWLNQHWSDAYYVYDLSSASDSQSVSCSVHGYRALVIANPLPRPGTPFLDLLLSAWFEGHSEQGRGPDRKGAADARAALQARGFTLRSGPSGIHASLRGQAVRDQLKGNVDLEAALASLAQLAHSQGGTPSGAS
jgi:hypothetical protein